MALLSTKGPVPKGAIKLTKDEAFDYQMKQIGQWPNFWEVWPFRIGVQMLSATAVLTSLRINSYVRSKLSLHHYGQFASIITVGLAAASLSGGGHYWYVTRELMTYNASCSVCIETRAIAIQLGSSIIYPCIISPLANFMLTFRYGTARLPEYSDVKGLFKFWIELIWPLRNKLKVHLVLNIIAAGFITYAENDSLYKVRKQIIEYNQKLREEAELEASREAEIITS